MPKTITLISKNDISIEHKNSNTIGNNIIYLRSKKNILNKNVKVNKLEKFSIKNKILNGHIKKMYLNVEYLIV